VPIKAAVRQHLQLTITVSNFYNPRLGDQPDEAPTSFIDKLTIGCKHTDSPIVPADLLANKIICGHWPTFRWSTQLGIGCRHAKGRASASEESWKES
jgi:hypothetical protein